MLGLVNQDRAGVCHTNPDTDSDGCMGMDGDMEGYVEQRRREAIPPKSRTQHTMPPTIITVRVLSMKDSVSLDM